MLERFEHQTQPHMRVFSDTENLSGLVQCYEDAINKQPGDISGNAVALKKFTARANSALASYWSIASKEEGTWQLDDSNQSDYPIIRATVTAGQRDYPLLTDGSGNAIGDVYKVRIADSSGNFTDLIPVDAQSQADTDSFSGTAQGMPTRYDKTANAIFLDPVPDYTRAASLEVYISRTASQFSITDTDKKPGVPADHHDYFFLKPAAEYARTKDPGIFPALQAAVLDMEQDIRAYFSKRPRDERGRIGVSQQDNK
jgi:hypothetical protein